MILLVIICSIITSCSESPEKYNKRALVVADSIISSTDYCFGFSTMTHKVWQRAVFDHYYNNPLTNSTEYCCDFNEALAKWKSESENLQTTMKLRKKSVDSLIITIKESPRESQELLSTINNLYSIYLRMHNMAINPEGSLQAYTDSFNANYEKFKLLRNKLEIEKI
jgi:hypothetical protein